MKNKKQLLFAMFLFMAGGFVSCSDDDNTIPEPEPEFEVVKGPVAFTLPDFADSYVYLVKDVVSTFAAICKEYIPAFSKEKQAIVVYPYNKDGEIDLTQGFVTDNGGSIRWNEDGTYVYTAGTAQAVTKLYVDSCKILTSAEPKKVGMVQPDQLRDCDGNLYGIVKIGTQQWIMSNFRAKRFDNGESIVTGLVEGEWDENTSGAYTVYGISADGKYDPESVPEDIDTQEKMEQGYGLLYNWHAAASANFAPEGWKLPSADDVEKLKAFLDEGILEEGESTAGGMMKETGLIHWDEATDWVEDPETGEWVQVGIGNVGATNVSGFTAVGSGSGSWGCYSSIKSSFEMWTTSDSYAMEGNKLYYKIANYDADLSDGWGFGASLTDLKSVRFLRK